MPELPEVESVVRSLRDGSPSLIGERIAKVNVVWNGLVSGASVAVFQAGLEGCSFESILRHGKFLIFGLKKERLQTRFLIIHLRMTGRLFLVPQSRPVERHTRLALMLDDGRALRFDDPRKFGRVWLVADPVEVTGGLGPDALTAGLDEFTARLASHRRRLKPLLLDQSFLAGIGNIYADEILFRARLHPLTNSSDLSPGEVRRLHGAIKAVLAEAVAANGANIDGVFEAGGYLVSVYGREGEPCIVCGTTIVKTRVGQRGTRFCPRCQRLHPAP